MQMNKKYKKGELDQAKLDRLTQAGWKPHLENCTRRDVRRWDEMYERMVEWSKRKGNVTITKVFLRDVFCHLTQI